MKLRLRALPAFVTLLALLLSVAEGVWASTCMPGMEISMDSDSAAPAVGGMMMDMGMSGEDSEGQSSESPTPPSCPFVPANPGGSCVAASFPAASAAAVVLSPESALLVASPDQTRALLLAVAFFHPPRA